MKELNQKLAVIQTKLKAKKSSYNSFGKYYFRKSEDILEAIKPFLIEQGVTVTINEEIVATDPVPTMQSTATISDGKDAIHATALVGVDLNQKGMQTSQQFGAASTYGKKYALGNLLLIDDTEDADSGKKATSTTIDKIKQAAKPAITKQQIAQAKDYVAAGGKIEAIESKYKLTNEQKADIIKA
ncbi:ERF family protein [bacterium]|nr:ERF family protein [bacterium]